MEYLKNKFGGKSESVDKFYNSNSDGVLYVSHASIIVSLNGKKYLFDPVLAKPPHLGSWLFYPEMQRDDRMLKVDGVFVSHQHQDHYDVDFLKLIPKTIPIYIVAGRLHFEKMLEESGIPYTLIPENEKFDLGNGVSCVGIQHEYNGIDSAIAISNDLFTVYHGNDCYLSNSKLEIIKKHYSEIDVACIPFAYVHWYPFLLDEVDEIWRKNESERLIKKYLEYGLEQVKFLNPHVAIPFGANMFYCDDIKSEHNKAVLSPFEFKKYAEVTNFPLVEKIKTLFSGDIVLSKDNKSERIITIDQKEFTIEDLHIGFEKYLNQVKKIGTGFDFSEIENLKNDELENLDFIKVRLSFHQQRIKHKIFISNMDDESFENIEIDLENHSVVRKKMIESTYPFHHFKLTNLAYKAYMSEKYSFNEIIASSRFRLIRKPNDYQLDVLKIVNNIL